MEIKRDFDIAIDEERIIASQGKRFHRLLKKTSVSVRFHLIQEKLPELFTPVVGYQRFKIHHFIHDKIELANGVKIGGGPVVDVMQGATEFIILILTVGSKVDQAINDFQAEKDLLSAVILDNIASLVVSQVRAQFLTWIKGELAKENLFMSIPMSPGESDWSIKDQKTLFGLLEPEKVGMQLNESCLMLPLKSLSITLGVSSKPFGVDDVSRCEFCAMNHKCRFRDHKIDPIAEE